MDTLIEHAYIFENQKEHLISKLKHVTLRESNIMPYENSVIDIITLMPSEISPCQRYVLIPELKKIESLRWDLLEKTENKIDILRLNSYITCAVDAGYGPEILPPVCEEFFTADFKVKIKLNDGLHRVYLAYQMGVPVNVVYIRGISVPYYSHILPNGWEGVEMIESLTESYIKKFHISKEYKKLFRDFTSQFDNLSVSRSNYEKG